MLPPAQKAESLAVPAPRPGGPFGGLAGWVRLDNWESETVSPVTQLLIFPGVPTVCLLLGCYLGWRLWKRFWGPRVVDGRRR